MRSFTASTRDVLARLGLRDPKTLHRRRDLYMDKAVPAKYKIFKVGVHYVRKSPASTTLVWDLELAVETFVEASKLAHLESSADKVLESLRSTD